MWGSEDIYLGFDPGGAKKFGVAAISGSNVKCATVNTVAEAVTWSASIVGSRRPVAAGIDTILHWCDGPGGRRVADELLSYSYKKSHKSVMAPNSLFGAMAVGGVALAIRLRELWPDIKLNETHPKVLFSELFLSAYPRSGSGIKYPLLNEIDPGDMSEDEFDALLSAWATRQAFFDNWPDIIGCHQSLIFPVADVSYRWPRVLI